MKPTEQERNITAEKDYVIPLGTAEANSNNNNNNNNNEIRDDLNNNGFTSARGTPIQTFYAGQKVFVTGGTGFLGKVLVEKLLRSCPEISTLFLLVRVKKDKSVKARIDELFSDPLYEPLRKISPKFHHKIVGVEGDCSVPGLGLSPADRELLLREVSIVFHSAATVRFYERLDEALKINVASALDIMDLCRNMDKFKVLMHVSTAYSNCHLTAIDEKFYPHVTTYEDLQKQLKGLEEQEIEKITPNIVRNWPNTYTFTKSLAEKVVKERNNGLTVGIFRPAIIISSAREPLKGWIDNFYGPTGAVAAAYGGILRTLRINGSIPTNVVPVDYTANALIACAWDVAKNHPERKNDKMMIYNYVATVESTFTWKNYVEVLSKYANKYPLSTAIWIVKLKLQKSAAMTLIVKIFYHYIPAILIDLSRVCLGYPPRLLKAYARIHNYTGAIEHFITNDWKYTNDNVVSMWERLTAKDQDIFEFSIKNIDWSVYMRDCIKGIRYYLLKEDFSNLEACRKRARRFVWMNEMLNGLFFSLALWTLWKIFSALFF